MNMLPNDIEKWIETGYGMISNLDRYHKHVSFIFRKGQMLASGINSRKTHPLAARHNYRMDERHSELDAYIRLPDKNSDKLVLVNIRYGMDGFLKMAKPCCKCQAWCLGLFDEIWYTDRDGNLVELQSGDEI